MNHIVRRLLAGLPVLSLAACSAAPPDESVGESTGGGQEALVIANPNNHVFPLLPIAPTYYSSGPSAPTVKMEPASGYMCLLQSAGGNFTGWSSTAQIVTSGGYYYLETAGGTTATASCVPTSNFTGTGTGTITSTINAPYWLSVVHNQNYTGNSQNQLTMWTGNNAACFISGLSGDWTGFETGATKTNPLTAYAEVNGVAYLTTNGPGIRADVNCFAFPNRSTLVSTVSAAQGDGASTNLPNTSASFCGVATWVGDIVGGSGFEITHTSSGAQTLSIQGNVDVAYAQCIPYAQPGS